MKTYTPDELNAIIAAHGAWLRDEAGGQLADLSGADFYCRPSCQGQSVKGGDQPVKVVK